MRASKRNGATPVDYESRVRGYSASTGRLSSDFIQRIRAQLPKPSSSSVPDTGSYRVQRNRLGTGTCVYEIKSDELSGEMPPVVGFLVSYDRHAAGEFIALRAGRWILTSEASPGAANYLVIKDKTISPNHATILVTAKGELQVVDQFSEQGTAVLRSENDKEEELIRGIVGHGDVVRFGSRRFSICLVQNAPVHEEVQEEVG